VAIREPLLLWLFASGSLILLAVVALLAVGALFGVLWLTWKGLLFLAETIDRLIGGGRVRAHAEDHTSVPRRVRRPGAQRIVRVQAGLVSVAASSPGRRHGGVPRRRRARARRGDG